MNALPGDHPLAGAALLLVDIANDYVMPESVDVLYRGKNPMPPEELAALFASGR